MRLTRSLLGSLLVLAPMLTGAASAQDTIPRAPRYLPYGVPVPVGEAIDAGPEPYQPAKHGPPLRNTQPERNMAAQRGANLPRVDSNGKGPRGRPDNPGPPGAAGGAASDGPDLPRPMPGSGDRGFWINAGTGVYAANDAQTDLVIPDNAVGTTIYAPTHMPAGNSCIETTTAHWRDTGQPSTTHGHGFWDHCFKKGWYTFEYMDATWKSKYVRTLDGEDRYYTQVDKSGNCWRGLLYNFTAGQWEEKVSPAVCGSSTQSGWTMWESHGLMDVAKVCPSFPSIRASGIQILTSSGWVALGTGNSSVLGPYGMCWTNNTYAFHVHAANSDWHAHTPSP